MNKTRIVSAPLLSLVASLALAGDGNSQGENKQGHDHVHAWGQNQRAVSAPEIDLAQAMGALVLLGGAVAIIRGYRGKK